MKMSVQINSVRTLKHAHIHAYQIPLEIIVFMEKSNCSNEPKHPRPKSLVFVYLRQPFGRCLRACVRVKALAVDSCE